MPFESTGKRDRNPLLTIVVAAYNVEGYIEEALGSLISQPHADLLKIVVVDDGSRDDTPRIVEALAARNGSAQIELIQQKNAGVSAARNTGLAAVRTPYVGFLDGDDIYLKGFMDAIVPLLEDGRADMIEYNIDIIDDDGRKLDAIEVVNPARRGAHAMDRAALQSFADDFHTFVWARIYRTELFDDVRFPAGRHYEDMAIMPSLYLRTQRIHRLAEPLIGYRRRFGSITQKASLNDMKDLRTVGVEALSHCDGGERDDYWLTVFDKAFQRACHVCARVDHASFKAASATLASMAADHHSARDRLAARSGRPIGQLRPYELNVRTDRCVHFVKGLVKRVLKRSLDHQQRPRHVQSHAANSAN
jgi:hypothetical protein